MSESIFDFIVIGRGLIGSAAARYLTGSGATVALIGPEEPADPASHDGVFSSHYDNSRIVRRTTRDMQWANLAQRSLRAYGEIQRETGARFLYERPGIHLVPAAKESVFIQRADAIASAFAVPHKRLANGTQIRSAAPLLNVPEATYGLIEFAPAGYLDPRALIAAQVALATRNGAHLVSDIATDVQAGSDAVSVTTRQGMGLRAKRVLVAAGAYSLHPGLLPVRLAMTVKSETVLLARISAKEAERLGELPTIVYELDAPRVGTPYVVPPIRAADGHHYIKMGANTFADRYLETPAEMNRWMRSGPSDSVKDEMLATMRGLINDLDVISAATKRCLVSYTPGGWPMIDQVDEGLFVAVGGNGLGAKASDAIGALAAELMTGRRWDASVDPECFKAHYTDSSAADVERSRNPTAHRDDDAQAREGVIGQRPFGQTRAAQESRAKETKP